MKKIILVLITVVQVAFAQTTETANSGPKERKIALGVSFSPDYSYRTITISQSNPSYPLLTLFNDNHLPIFGYTMGVKLSTVLKKRFTYETGILFSKKGFSTKPQLLIGYGPPDPSSPQRAISSVNYYSFDIPLKVNFYALKTKKGGLSVSAGIINNLFFSTVYTTVYEFDNYPSVINKQADSGFEYKPSVLLAIGYQQQLSERLFLKAEPSYRRMLLPFSNSGSWNTYLYSFGLDMSVFFKL